MSQRQSDWAVWAVVLAGWIWVGDWQTALTRASSLSSLSGYVYVDQNFDGLYDPAVEWVLPDVAIWLSEVGSSAAPVATRTDDLGFYQFSGLSAGEYDIAETPIPGGYLNVNLELGRLVDAVTGQPVDAFRGTIVNYDQQQGIPPHFAGIELPAGPTRGVGYNFGQLWTGKAWYLTDPNSVLKPPHAQPPTNIPEPSTVALLAVALVGAAVWGWRRGRR